MKEHLVVAAVTTLPSRAPPRLQEVHGDLVEEVSAPR